jgi:inhibitor of cysteine peptidase
MNLAPTPSEAQNITATPNPGEAVRAPRVSPYIKLTVDAVEIRYLKTNPVQVELLIRGVLPDQCKYNFYSVENRKDQNIKISLDAIHPADNTCGQTAQNIEYVLLLGRDMPESERGLPAGDYTLMVNNFQANFSIKE